LPPLSAQLVLDETSLSSYSQEPTGKEKKSPTTPLYPKVNRTLEKDMPASITSVSSDSSEGSESTSYVRLYKSRIDRRYEKFARQCGFDDTKTKEENIDSIQRKVAAHEEQMDWKYPNDKEEIELERAKKLVETFLK